MALAPRVQPGPYEIVSALGKGGMGEVPLTLQRSLALDLRAFEPSCAATAAQMRERRVGQTLMALHQGPTQAGPVS